MIKLKINCSRIPKERLFEGKNGKYLDLVLFDKPDSYGNDGFVKIDVSKEARESGDNGEIIGNWKNVGSKPPPANRTAPPARSTPPAAPAPRNDDPEDDIPF